MTENPKNAPNGVGGGSESDHPNVLIENFNHFGNDLEELRKIAEIDPGLAKHVVDQKDKSDQREHTSERFGLVATTGLAVSALLAIVFLVFYGGIWQLLIGMGVIIAVGLLLRVVLTGEWSDTSWVGQIVSKTSEVMGGLPREGDD